MRAYTYFVKLPEIDHKFAIGCKNLSSASVADIIELAKDVGKRSNYKYTAAPLIYCAEIDKMIANDTALSFCISKGYTFEVLNDVNEANKLPSVRSRFPEFHSVQLAIGNWW
ncbi:hypothetical protein ACLKA6_005887 [Drosophila palustris]